MIISNESRISKSKVMSNFRKPRQYLATISIRHKDMLLVDSVTGSMKRWLETSKDIDQTLPNFVGLGSLDNHSCNLSIMVSLSLPCPVFVSLNMLGSTAAGYMPQLLSTLSFTSGGSEAGVVGCGRDEDNSSFLSCPVPHVSFLQMHTTPAVAREFGSFKQRALLALGRIVEEHGAKFAMPTQVLPLCVSYRLISLAGLKHPRIHTLFLPRKLDLIVQFLRQQMTRLSDIPHADHTPLECGRDGSDATR